MTRHHHAHHSMRFAKFARQISDWVGRPAGFVAALSLVAIWGALGPVFGFSDTWQLFINTTTTIVTFLMVFVIQSTQNREAAATQIKLDELIRVSPKAHTELLDLEELSDAELNDIHAHYERLAREARGEKKKRSH